MISGILLNLPKQLSLYNTTLLVFGKWPTVYRSDTSLHCCHCHWNQSGRGKDYSIGLRLVSNTTAESIHQKPVMWWDRKGRWFLIYGLISGSSLSKAEEREKEAVREREGERCWEIMMEEERQKRGRDITESKRQSKLKKDDSWSEVEGRAN